MEISTTKLIAKGISQIFARLAAAKKLVDKVFIVRLGRGFYGEYLGVRADGNLSLSDEIGKELSKRSVAAGLRPIGAVIYLQRKNLKTVSEIHSQAVGSGNHVFKDRAKNRSRGFKVRSYGREYVQRQQHNSTFLPKIGSIFSVVLSARFIKQCAWLTLSWAHSKKKGSQNLG